MRALLLVTLLLEACCKTCPPPSVVVRTETLPCLDMPMLADLLPVGEPHACEDDDSLETCLAKKCLPDEVCYDAGQHAALLFNVRLLVARAAIADARCLRKP